MNKEVAPGFKRRESGVIASNNEHVTSGDIDTLFGIDFKERVINRLKAFGFLPDNHQLAFFDVGRAHKGSQALYFTEEQIEGHMVYVSFLKPNSQTTVHMHHEPIFENYIWLGGASFLRRDNETHKLGQGQEVIRVSPGKVHQLTTRDEASLALIVMENAGLVPADKLHVPAVL